MFSLTKSKGPLTENVFLDTKSKSGAKVDSNLELGPFVPTSNLIPQGKPIYDIAFANIYPVFMFLKALGVFPIIRIRQGEYVFRPVSLAFGYSLLVFTVLTTYVAHVALERIYALSSQEGKFEEAVIAYLFFVNMFPLFIIPLMWMEAQKVSQVLTDWNSLEVLYLQISGRPLPLNLKSKAIIVAVILPITSIISVVTTHVTMGQFITFQVIPYCVLDNLTVMLVAYWYLLCECLSKSAYVLAEDFQRTLKHIGPAKLVAYYRASWLKLSKLARDMGIATCYTFTYLSLYLFFIITLSIYGLLSQISKGLGLKDIGLTLTALRSIYLLFFFCDEAHYASQNIQTTFQKKLLMVELSWMNSDAQTEINMFLRATEMNPSNMSCGGFFDINRVLFKSLLTTMVTYLVVLLQFQISIPEQLPRIEGESNNTISS